MNNIRKTTTLFTLLLLLYGGCFAGGWQKYLPNYGFNSYSYNQNTRFISDDYLPTKDGGVLIYASENVTYSFHKIIKLDKFGNVQWIKTVNQYEQIRNDTSIIEIIYEASVSGIENVLEISNNRYVVLHNGPLIYTTIIGQPTQITTQHQSLRYFTMLDKYGNLISRKFDTIDAIDNRNNKSTLYFDSVANNYVLFELKNQKILSKKNYDTTFNLLNETTINIDTTGIGVIGFLEKFNDKLFMSSYAFGNNSNFMVFDLQGNLSYKQNYLAHKSIENTIADSLDNLFPCTRIDIGDNRLTDFIFDSLNHLHLFNLRYVYDCANYIPIFIHIELNETGTVLKVKLNNINNKIDYIYHANSPVNTPFATVIPAHNQYCNILINKLDIRLDNYYVLRYNLAEDEIVNNNALCD